MPEQSEGEPVGGVYREDSDAGGVALQALRE